MRVLYCTIGALLSGTLVDATTHEQWALNAFEQDAISRCPCGETGAPRDLCLPVNWKQMDPTRQHEVFAFSVTNTSDWKHYDWRKITTVAWNEDKALLCHAHRRGVKVVIKHNFDAVEEICSASARKAWVEETYQRIVQNYADGVNIDTEAALHGDDAACLTSLVHELRAYLSSYAFTRNAQITYDVPWAPHGVDGRYYDWRGLAQASDFLFVMAYDMRSQVYDHCVAGANAPLALIRQGLEEYIIGEKIDPSKIVLGVPWYGYKYTCAKYDTNVDTCVIYPIPFHDAPCSDAAGSQLDFRDIMNVLEANPHIRVHWHQLTASPFFTLRASNESISQVWFDNPSSLRLKYSLVQQLQLRGIGMWNADSLDYHPHSSSAAQASQAMWAALDVEAAFAPA